MSGSVPGDFGVFFFGRIFQSSKGPGTFIAGVCVIQRAETAWFVLGPVGESVDCGSADEQNLLLNSALILHNTFSKEKLRLPSAALFFLLSALCFRLNSENCCPDFSHVKYISQLFCPRLF